ncbi:MAG: tetratricopeptide repeat protein, partial [Coleofasciculaceae cyanobacterium SM2_3_26]|nr:tetratricopeptide repeat protein [Coleofasciculaceae cyanobacterium SM2_3_26]
MWQEALEQPLAPADRAVLYTNLAEAYRQIGRVDRTIKYLDLAIEIHEAAADNIALTRVLVEQGQAYGELGQYERAIDLLQQAVTLARVEQDARAEVAAVGALGNAYWASGNYKEALGRSQMSLELARTLDDPLYLTAALNNLGNIYASSAQRHRFQAGNARSEGDLEEAERLEALAASELESAIAALEESIEISERRLDRLASLFSPADPGEGTAEF